MPVIGKLSYFFIKINFFSKCFHFFVGGVPTPTCLWQVFFKKGKKTKNAGHSPDMAKAENDRRKTGRGG
jgi:hypothetical protein